MSFNEEIDKLVNETEVIIKDKNENINNEKNNTIKEFAKAQAEANALADIVQDPKKALGTKLGMSIAEKVNSGDGKERLEKTADKLIDSGLKTYETQAETEEHKAIKDADTAYFDMYKQELLNAGINKQTYRSRMTQVVTTDHIWWNVWYSIFLWWVIGINELSVATKEVNSFFKFIIWTFATPILFVLIPTAISIGLCFSIIYLLYKLLNVTIRCIKNEIVRFVKYIKTKRKVDTTQLPALTAEEYSHKVVDIEEKEINTTKKEKSNKGGSK